jgi:hypothetical protein
MSDPGAAQQEQLSEKLETALKVCKRFAAMPHLQLVLFLLSSLPPW